MFTLLNSVTPNTFSVDATVNYAEHAPIRESSAGVFDVTFTSDAGRVIERIGQRRIAAKLSPNLAQNSLSDARIEYLGYCDLSCRRDVSGALDGCWSDFSSRVQPIPLDPLAKTVEGSLERATEAAIASAEALSAGALSTNAYSQRNNQRTAFERSIRMRPRIFSWGTRVAIQRLYPNDYSASRVATSIITSLELAIARRTLPGAVPNINVRQADDGSTLVEWRSGRRLIGISFEVNPSDSGWWYIRLDDQCQEQQDGPLADFDANHLADLMYK